MPWMASWRQSLGRAWWTATKRYWRRPWGAVELARGHDGVALALARALGADWIDRYVSEWRKVRLSIDGDDLLAAGIPEGAALGRGLAAAMRARLDGETSGAEDELRIALDAAREDDSE